MIILAWDRGEWDKKTSAGASVIGDNKPEKTETQFKSKKNSDNCLVCNRRIRNKNPICQYCGHYFYFNEEEKIQIINKFKQKGWNISDKKKSMYISSKFYKHYSSKDNDKIINHYGKLILNKSKKTPVLYVSNSKKRKNSIKNFLINSGKNDIIIDLSTNKFHDLSFLIKKDELNLNIKKFKEINKLLNKEYSIKIINDFREMHFIEYLSTLNQNYRYIDEEDSKKLNEFIKIYWQYQNSPVVENNEFKYELIYSYIDKYTKELLNLKKSINWFSNSVEKLNSLFDKLEINCYELSEKINIIDTLLILKYNPHLVNIKESEKFIKLIMEYQSINDSKGPITSKIKSLREKCKKIIDILQISYNYQIYKNFFNDINNKGLLNLVFSDLDLNYNNEKFDTFESVELNQINHINNELEKIKEKLEINLNDVHDIIENTKNTLKDLYNLINDKYSILKINEYTFNKEDFNLFYNQTIDLLDKYLKIYEIETEINYYNNIINNNLSTIWNGYFTDITKIKNKLNLDQEYTKLRDNKIINENSLKNFKTLSNEDIEFLKSLSDINEQNMTIYINLYENKNQLLQKVNVLANQNNNSSNDIYYKIFSEINSILKLEKLEKLTNCLKEFESDDLSNEYFNFLENLNPYKEIYYKYFDKNEFNICFEEIIEKLNIHIKYTELINNDIINKKSLSKIHKNSDFFNKVDELIDLGNNIISNLNLLNNPNIKSLDELSNIITENENKIILSNINNMIKLFGKQYINYFGCVILDDDKHISQEDRLQLFLISKIKLFRLWNNR